MITLKICSVRKDQLLAIAKLLLADKYVLDVNIIRDLERVELVNGELKSHVVYELQAKTKALLFPMIDSFIREKFSPVPEVYSSPIVHMDWVQSQTLIKEIKTI